MDRVERLLERHRPLLRQLCLAQFAGLEDVEDLEGAVIFTVCRRFETFDPMRGVFGTWLGAIVRHEASDVRRKAVHQPQCVPNDSETERMLDQVPGPDVDFLGFDFDGVDARELPSLLRQAFALVKLQGMTYAEAARRMGKTEGTVRTYVWKARRLMRVSIAAA